MKTDKKVHENLNDVYDDEFILNLNEDDNDELIEKDYLSSLVDQGDSLVYYEIENIYEDKKKKSYKNKYKLAKSPPVLKVKDDKDNEVSFYLTKNLTNELIETLEEVQRAYYGFNGPKDINKPKGFVNNIIYYFKRNPVKVISAFVIILFIVLINIL